jgi:hypothetical protein
LILLYGVRHGEVLEKYKAFFFLVCHQIKFYFKLAVRSKDSADSRPVSFSSEEELYGVHSPEHSASLREGFDAVAKRKNHVSI